MARQHQENFPVASLLCPPRLRPAVMAIYGFARTADDLADEGDVRPTRRLADLASLREELHWVAQGGLPNDRWRPVFLPLSRAIAAHRLPIGLFDDLLDAFEQDVVKTRYANRLEVLDYCRRSANPIGRLLLHLYGIDAPQALQESDAVCSALQLINFWQDASIDIPRGRIYLPQDHCAAHGVDEAMLAAGVDTRATRALLHAECDWARGLMAQGAPLVHRVPGRAGWELRGVVQGGLRVLDRIAAIGHRTLSQRPTLRRRDALPIAWAMLRMRPGQV